MHKLISIIHSTLAFPLQLGGNQRTIQRLLSVGHSDVITFLRLLSFNMWKSEYLPQATGENPARAIILFLRPTADCLFWVFFSFFLRAYHHLGTIRNSATGHFCFICELFPSLKTAMYSTGFPKFHLAFYWYCGSPIAEEGYYVCLSLPLPQGASSSLPYKDWYCFFLSAGIVLRFYFLAMCVLKFSLIRVLTH